MRSNKNIFSFLLLVFFLLMGFSVQAQKNVIKANPFSIFVLTANGGYERVITPKISAQVTGYYSALNMNWSFLQGYSARYRIWSVTPEARFYPLEQQSAPNGLYVAPFVRYRNLKVEGVLPFIDTDGNLIDLEARAKINSAGPGVLLGYQLLVGDLITLEAFGGPAFYFSKLDTDILEQTNIPIIEDYRGPSFSGFSFRGGATVGIAF